MLELISNSKGYDYALLTTFNYDIVFFERFMLNRLYDNGIKNVSVFVDAKELCTALNDVTGTSIGIKYIVNPIEMQGAFHPKLLLLLGKDKAKLLVSSANLTTNGYLRNNEIFNEFVFDSNHVENGKIIVSALDFFVKLNELSYKQDQKLFDEIKQLSYFNAIIENEELQLLNNLNESLLHQVTKIVPNVKSIDIAVPFYDNNLSAVTALSEAYPGARINLFVQNKKSRFPVAKKQLDCITDINIYNGFSETNNAFYHGKVFKFETDDASYILYGSANCTQAAFVKAFKDEANIECVVLEKGNRMEFDCFFEDFLCVNEELECEEITYAKSDNGCFYYKYGVLDSNLTLYLGKKHNGSFSVLLGGEELKATCKDDLVVVEIEQGKIPTESVFEIIIKYQDKIETIKCWYICPEVLEFNRLNEISNVIYSFDFDKNEDRYIEDKMVLIKEISLTTDEYQEEKDVNAIINAASSECSTDEYHDEDDGIVSYVIPSADLITKYNKYKRINAIRLSYIDAFYNRFTSISATYSHHSVNETHESRVREMVPITQEKRFVRFVNKRLNEFSNKDYIAVCEYNHYLSGILIFINVFEKYANVDNEDGLFDIEYIISNKTKMIKNLLSKVIDESKLTHEEIYDTIALGIQLILENHFITSYPDAYKELENKRILNKLNSLFDLRKRYSKPTYEAIYNINRYCSRLINMETALKYIDDLFGYKERGQLNNIIYKDFGNNAEINIDEKRKNAHIRVIISGSLKNYMKIKPKTDLELKKYCAYFGIDKYQLEVINNIQSDLNTAAKSILFEVNIKENKTVRTIKRNNGKVEVDVFNRFYD